MKKVAIITNVPAPYRVPIFERFADECQLNVWFTQQLEGRRHWEPSVKNMDLNARYLRFYRVGKLVINPYIYTRLKQEDSEVVIVGENLNSLQATVTAAVYCKMTGSTFVIWTEGIDTNWHQGTIVEAVKSGVDRIRRFLYDVADICIGYSEAAGDYLQARGVPDENIVTGIQTYPKSEIVSAKQVEDIQHDTVLYLGQLIDRKGIERLIEIAKEWDSSRRLIIAGDGPLRESLQEKAKGQDNIRFEGFVSEQRKANLMSTANVFVLPTWQDTWGLVVNESLYHGTPVVVTEAAGSAQLVRETNAGVVVSSTKEAIGRGIEQALDNINRFESNAQNAAKMAVSVEKGVQPFIKALKMSDF
jgi:glycosyltransferase involved in cell wall biosynthesis